MKIAQSVRFGIWLLIGLNLLMALGCIWIFVRMTPAIEVIIEQNARSLEACEEMLASLTLSGQDPTGELELRKTFVTALERAQKNITEPEEPLALDTIRSRYEKAFSGAKSARMETVAAITELARINREAMISADSRAKQFGNAGAWGVVFMSVVVFLAELIFKKTLFKNLIEPLEEINQVISAYRDGDGFRRCTGPDLSVEMRHLYDSINTLVENERRP